MIREIREILEDLESEADSDFQDLDHLIDELRSRIDSSNVDSIKLFLYSDTSCFTRAMVARVALESLGEEFIPILAVAIFEMKELGYHGEDFLECLEGFVLKAPESSFSSYNEMVQSADPTLRGAALIIARSFCMGPFREEVIDRVLKMIEDGSEPIAMLASEAASRFEYERVRESLYRVAEKSLEHGDQSLFRHVLRGISWNRDDGDLRFLRSLGSKFRDPALHDVILSIEYEKSKGLRRIWMYVVRRLMP